MKMKPVGSWKALLGAGRVLVVHSALPEVQKEGRGGEQLQFLDSTPQKGHQIKTVGVKSKSIILFIFLKPDSFCLPQC